MEKHRLVPLVIYRNDIREVIGTAKVDETGWMECTIHDSDLTGKLIHGVIGEMQIAIATEDKIKKSDPTHCWACVLGKCGQYDDPSCGCCRTAHE